MTLERNHILVIKACKGHFDKEFGNAKGYDVAEAIIQHLVYGNPERVDVAFMTAYLREILLNTRLWTLERWEAFTDQAMKNAHAYRPIFTSDKIPYFLESYLQQHFMAIQNLKVWNGKEMLIDTNIEMTEDEINKMLGRQ